MPRLPFLVATDPNGRPAVDVLSAFAASDLDDADTTQYFGFLAADGAWMVQKYDTSAGQIRYCTGRGDYLTNWTNRAGLTYSLFSDVF